LLSGNGGNNWPTSKEVKMDLAHYNPGYHLSTLFQFIQKTPYKLHFLCGSFFVQA
ncbi:Hypothetical protein FKW44_009893, partial [Caligus rogercresseyi]